MSKKKRFTVHFDESQIEKIKLEAEIKKVSVSEFIRDAVDAYIQEMIERDPLFDIIGIGSSSVDDVAENHDQYLVKILDAEHHRYGF